MTDIEKIARDVGVEFSGKLAFKSGTSILATRQEWEAFAQAVARRCAEIAQMYELGESSAYYIREEFGIREEP